MAIRVELERVVLLLLHADILYYVLCKNVIASARYVTKLDFVSGRIR